MSGKDSCRDGKWKKASIFGFLKLDENGAGGVASFELDQIKTDTPTLYFDTFRSHPTMMSGRIHRIHYRLNPTNPGLTYTLRLWQEDVAGDYESNAHMLYESPALQADDIDYDRAELDIPFVLDWPGIIYYSIDWSAAPGVTPGFIHVSGEKVE